MHQKRIRIALKRAERLVFCTLLIQPVVFLAKNELPAVRTRRDVIPEERSEGLPTVEVGRGPVQVPDERKGKPKRRGRGKRGGSTKKKALTRRNAISRLRRPAPPPAAVEVNSPPPQAASMPHRQLTRRNAVRQPSPRQSNSNPASEIVETLPLAEFRQITGGAVDLIIRHGNADQMEVVWSDGQLHRFLVVGREVRVARATAYLRRGHRMVRNPDGDVPGRVEQPSASGSAGRGLRGNSNPARGRGRRGAVRGRGL